MRLLYLSAIALAFTTPAAAETIAQQTSVPAPPTVERHAGHTGPSGQPANHGGGSGAGQSQHANCCADANNNGRMDCCEGGGCACCSGRGQSSAGQSERPAAPNSR